LSHVSSQDSKNYAPCNNSRRHGKTFFDFFFGAETACRELPALTKSAWIPRFVGRARHSVRAAGDQVELTFELGTPSRTLRCPTTGPWLDLSFAFTGLPQNFLDFANFLLT
jgi:hypothetical protein